MNDKLDKNSKNYKAWMQAWFIQKREVEALLPRIKDLFKSYDKLIDLCMEYNELLASREKIRVKFTDLYISMFMFFIAWVSLVCLFINL